MNIKKASLALAVIAVSAAPVMASAASQTANTTINATVASVITAGTSSTVTLNITPTAGGVVTTASDTVTVSTNNTLGYNLTVADSNATTVLDNGAGSTLTASAGTKAAPVTLANNTWGVAVNTGTTGIGANGFDASYSVETNNASSTSKWAGMPATGSPMLLKSTAAVATNDTTTVWYGAKATSAQANGTYTDTVTYTATTN